MNGIIHPNELKVGQEITVYRWADFQLYSREDCFVERHGVLVQKLRNDNFVVRMDKGYTECWSGKRLMVAMNEPILHRCRRVIKTMRGLNPYDMAQQLYEGEEIEGLNSDFNRASGTEH